MLIFWQFFKKWHLSSYLYVCKVDMLFPKVHHFPLTDIDSSYLSFAQILLEIVTVYFGFY